MARDRVASAVRFFICAGGMALALGAGAASAEAQYFGRNKVQYQRFDFQVLRTGNFDIHFYPAEREAVQDAARMVERWNVRLSELLRHRIDRRTPIVLYADHGDFQQTNTISGGIDESTGGVTESLQNRVILPLTAHYAGTDHVLGHELVHAFQYDIAGVSRGSGGGGMSRLPLWLVEGMAEYLSSGRNDPHTAMWMRDAVLRDDIPTLQKLTRDPRYFPYRFGQAVWAYIGGRWGDAVITDLYRASVRNGWERGFTEILGIGPDSLSADWAAALRQAYVPHLEGRTAPAELGRRLIAPGGGAGETILAPALSPDGRFVAFLSERDFTMDLFVADATTGEVVRKLASTGADSHSDAVSFMGSAGTWSPDGRRFAFVVFTEGDNALTIVDVATGRVERRVRVPAVGAIAHPAWSPDGRQLAFSGSAGGISDLYLLDLESGSVRRLTQDRYADLQPAWSPDGRTLAFVTDRGEATDFQWLSYGPPRLALLDVATATVRTIGSPPWLGGGKQVSPHFSPDGRDVYFVSDADGFSDVYRLRLETGALFRVTRVATGIAGLTALSPALSVAASSGDVFVSVFDARHYAIHALAPDALAGEAVPAGVGLVADAGVLPPVDVRTAVGTYLADPHAGLDDGGAYDVRDYVRRPRLSYIGAPALGLGIDPYGVGFHAELSAYFTDVLGNHGLSVQGLANGGFKDLGGQFLYENSENRWNWGAGLGRTPYRSGYGFARDTIVERNGRRTVGTSVTEFRQRLFVDQALASARYPFSATRRVEASAGLTRIGYDYEVVNSVQVGSDVVSKSTTSIAAPGDLHLYQAGAAMVGDNSLFGIASPFRGGRYRLELQPTFGSLRFVTALADGRRYVHLRPFTLAMRGLHYGRYGGDDDSRELGSLFLGAETLVRGYARESFLQSECTASTGPTGCAAVDRLTGSRLGVANVELRVPLFGNERMGLIDFPFVPTEVAAFIDAGVAWTAAEGPTFSGAGARAPVTSAGLSARFNVFGFAILEAYYAQPFQRPERGAHFGFNLAPGW